MAAKDVTKKRKAPVAEATVPKKQKKVEKKTVAIQDENGDVHVAKKTKTVKPAPSAKQAAKEAVPKKTTKTKTSMKVKPTPEPVESSDDESDAGVSTADRTAALLKGFESSDEEDVEEDADGGVPTDVAPVADADIPGIPKKANSALTKRGAAQDDEPPAILYIGRVPHGFYEPQMRAYFSQFGDIAHLRLSRNRRTGRSKHYAFVQFTSGDVGRIVADTMDNYMLFNHILKVRVLSAEQVERMGPALWAGEGRRFKVVPWGGMERGQLKSADRAQWEKRVSKEQARRSSKAKKLEALGYDFAAPALQSVDTVTVQEKPALLEQVRPKRSKKTERIEAAPTGENDLEAIIAAQKPAKEEAPVVAAAKKTKKSKDGKAVEQTIATKTADGTTTKRTKRKVSGTA